MAKTYKYTRPSQKRDYNLSYHLNNTSNLRLKGKIKKLIEIFPKRYNCQVVFTKRRIWFIKSDKKFMQAIVENQIILLKIKIDKGWLETGLPDWEDFGRVWSILEKQSILANL